MSSFNQAFSQSIVEYCDVASSAVGTVAKNHEQAEHRYRRLLSQSVAIASTLESAGIVAYRDDQSVTAINELTGEAELLHAFRHLNIIPIVASVERRGLLNELTYYLDKNPGYWRYAVITWGERVPYDENLKDRGREMRRLISRWASEAGKRYDIEVIFRGDEFTFSDAGAHGHSNIIYRPRRYLSPEEWGDFLKFSGQKFGTWWCDCGELNDPREVVKYVCKLSTDYKEAEDKRGIYGVDVLSAENLSWFHYSTIGQRLVAPMGDFASFRRDLKTERVRVVRYRDELRLMHKLRGRPRKSAKTPGGAPKPENIVLSRTLPAPGEGGLMATRSIVVNHTLEPRTPEGRTGLELVQNNQCQAQQWAVENGWSGEVGEAKNQAPFIVHNITTTVRDVKAVSQAELFEVGALGQRAKPTRRRVNGVKCYQPDLFVWAMFEDVFNNSGQLPDKPVEYVIPFCLTGFVQGLGVQRFA